MSLLCLWYVHFYYNVNIQRPIYFYLSCLKFIEFPESKDLSLNNSFKLLAIIYFNIVSPSRFFKFSFYLKCWLRVYQIFLSTRCLKLFLILPISLSLCCILDNSSYNSLILSSAGSNLLTIKLLFPLLFLNDYTSLILIGF